MNVEVLQLLGREIFLKVHLVFRGQNHIANACTFGGQNFLLDTAHRQHVSAQRDLSSHGHQRRDALLGQQ